ncbi:PQQ-binding-like beta-propeller repeat protein, partial [Candidatus Bathyarchaeota archaeon]|nr:PQQ-binding-like beta-propeller repeat protein [Candidatus Bathyarchaeota archaeon]
ATIALALILTISALITTTPLLTTVEAADDYGDLLQYEWPSDLLPIGNRRFSAGPGPTAPNVLWKTKIPGLTAMNPIAFNGMVFVVSRTKTYALDGFDGSIVWTADVSGRGILKRDDTRMIVGSYCLETTTGNIIWQATNGFALSSSFSSAYDPDDNYYFISTSFPESKITAWDLSDPAQPPTVAWVSPVAGRDEANQIKAYGDGKLFVSGSLAHVCALDVKTGELLWTAQTQGVMNYRGSYYDGLYLQGALDNTFYAINAETGEIEWTYNPGTYWGFWASQNAAGNGMVYEHNTDGYFYALDVTTGECVWKYASGSFASYPSCPLMADGIVFAQTGSAITPDALGRPTVSEFSAMNATTGQLLWQIPLELGGSYATYASLAYGNLYMCPSVPISETTMRPGQLTVPSNGEVWCISSAPQDWAMFRRDPAHTGEGAGPQDLQLKWKFETNGAIISSPAVADGVAYVGSQDKNIYAIDAETGTKIWNFETDYAVKSSPAVVEGKLYTGADSGWLYCLDAKTGAQLWKSFAGGVTDLAVNSQVVIQWRSSPTVVGTRVYVASLDKNLYCFNKDDGTLLWAFPTAGWISTTPTVVDGAVYFTSNDPTPSVNGTLYKLDAITGNEIWRQGIPYTFAIYQGPQLISSPTVAEGMVFVPQDHYDILAFNATTADFIWKYESEWDFHFMVDAATILYANGRLFFGDYFALTSLNATTGEKLWDTWLAREVETSPAYSFGRIYAACENQAFFVLDAETGEKLSYYDSFGTNSIWSSPALYNGRTYIGCFDWNLYCFEQAQVGELVYYGDSAPTASPASASSIPQAEPVEPAPVVQ